MTDLAEQEGVTDAYVCQLLPLTCLAPDIVEAILDGRQPTGLRLAELLGNGPLVWNHNGRFGASSCLRTDENGKEPAPLAAPAPMYAQDLQLRGPWRSNFWARLPVSTSAV